MNIKPGTIGRINRNARRAENVGIFIEVIRPFVSGEQLPGHPSAHREFDEAAWVVRTLGSSILVQTTGGATYYAKVHAVREIAITPFGDNPGNEDFVIKARKTLPPPIPVTGPVTINERGEVEQ